MTACSNSIVGNLLNISDNNVALTEEQKTPEYAIEQWFKKEKIGDVQYEYLIIEPYLFLNAEGYMATAFRSDDESFSFDYPREVKGNSIGKFYGNEVTIMGEMLNDDGTGIVDFIVTPLFPEDGYKIYDTTGEDFIEFDKLRTRPRFIKVLKEIPKDYKVFCEINGRKYELFDENIFR
ncbi:MAG: hypothetical protein RR710_09380 [Oscillospiraceae bacterium]